MSWHDENMARFWEGERMRKERQYRMEEAREAARSQSFLGSRSSSDGDGGVFSLFVLIGIGVIGGTIKLLETTTGKIIVGTIGAIIALMVIRFIYKLVSRIVNFFSKKKKGPWDINPKVVSMEDYRK